MFKVECKEKTQVFDVDNRIVPMSRLFEELNEEEYTDKNDTRPVPLDQIDEATFELVLLFCQKSGYDDRREITRRRLLEKPDINLSYEELYKQEEETKDEVDARDETWKIEYFKNLTLD